MSSIEDIRDCPEEDFKVCVEGNEVRITGGSDNEIGIYDMQGRKVKSATTNEGKTDLRLPAGIYIVTCGNQRTKAVLK